MTPAAPMLLAAAGWAAFAPAGFDVQRVVRGDLNGDGLDDAVVVATPAPGDPAKRFAPRVLSIVVASAGGGFSLAARNATLGACRTCGGAYGDGLAEVAIEGGERHVANEGGGRARWSNVYRFRHDAASDEWRMSGYSAGVSSTMDEQSKRIEFDAADLATVRFDTLSPGDLPTPKLEPSEGPIREMRDGDVLTWTFADGSSRSVLIASPSNPDARSAADPRRFMLRMDRIGPVSISPDRERLDHIDPRFTGLSLAYTDCLRTPAERPGDVEDCASDEARRQEERLERALSRLRALRCEGSCDPLAADAVSLLNLDRVQRQWAAFRASDCDMRTLRYGSTWAPAVAARCEAESTALRAQTLEDLRLSLTARAVGMTDPKQETLHDDR